MMMNCRRLFGLYQLSYIFIGFFSNALFIEELSTHSERSGQLRNKRVYILTWAHLFRSHNYSGVPLNLSDLRTRQ